MIVFTDLYEIRQENCVKMSKSADQEKREKLDVFTEKSKGYDLG